MARLTARVLQKGRLFNRKADIIHSNPGNNSICLRAHNVDATKLPMNEGNISYFNLALYIERSSLKGKNFKKSFTKFSFLLINKVSELSHGTISTVAIGIKSSFSGKYYTRIIASHIFKIIIFMPGFFSLYHFFCAIHHINLRFNHVD